MGTKAKAPRKYGIRAVIFQEGEWLCAQCLEYNLVAQAKSLPKLRRSLQQFIVGHVVVRLRHGQQPFPDLPRAPAKYWTMFRQSRLPLPAPMFKLGALKSHGVVVAPPQVRIAVPSPHSVANPIRLCVFPSVPRGVLLWDVMGFNPREVARAGRKVYEQHRAELERRHRGRYVLIDVKTEKLFLAESPEAAYQQAAAESGPFHLVRVGDRAAFRSRRLPNGDDTRIAR